MSRRKNERKVAEAIVRARHALVAADAHAQRSWPVPMDEARQAEAFRKAIEDHQRRGTE